MGWLHREAVSPESEGNPGSEHQGRVHTQVIEGDFGGYSRRDGPYAIRTGR